MRKRRTRAEGMSRAWTYRSSGLTRREFSKRHGVTECSVQYWCAQLNRNGVTGDGLNILTCLFFLPLKVPIEKTG
jgi:hypothetical protein